MYNIKYFFSNKQDGNLALHILDNKEKVISNRKKLAFKLNKNLEDFIYMNQIHGGNIKNIGVIDKGSGSRKIDISLSFDGIVTKEKEIILSVLVADCLPILFYDEQKRVVGVAHAGWKGTYKKISQNILKKMLQIGANLENIKIIIGPAISQYSYEVGKEIGIKFREEVKTKSIDGKQYLDLKLENKLQALELGIKEDNIEMIDIDTFIDSNYFSARRDGFNKGRFGGFIYIK